MKILQREQELLKQQIEEERIRKEASARSEEDFHQTPKLKVMTMHVYLTFPCQELNHSFSKAHIPSLSLSIYQLFCISNDVHLKAGSLTGIAEPPPHFSYR